MIVDTTMDKEIKESIGNEYIRRVKLICKSNLNAGNFIFGMSAWAIWTEEELQDMDRKSRKIMAMCKCLHPRSSVARFYMKQKEEWRGRISVEDCITTERRGLYDYLKRK